jgi:hypothetical protein
MWRERRAHAARGAAARSGAAGRQPRRAQRGAPRRRADRLAHARGVAAAGESLAAAPCNALQQHTTVRRGALRRCSRLRSRARACAVCLCGRRQLGCADDMLRHSTPHTMPHITLQRSATRCNRTPRCNAQCNALPPAQAELQAQAARIEAERHIEWQVRAAYARDPFQPSSCPISGSQAAHVELEARTGDIGRCPSPVTP